MTVDGWLAPGTARILATHLNKRTKIVIELGSWKGLSALFISGAAPNAQVYCIDTWRGSSEHQHLADLNDVLSQFKANTGFNPRIHHRQADTITGMVELAKQGVRPELVYVDAAHEYSAVHSDLETASRLFPAARIVGDDYRWPSVRLAVNHYASTHDLLVEVDGNGWAFHRQAKLEQRIIWRLRRLRLAIEQFIKPWQPPAGFQQVNHDLVLGAFRGTRGR